MTIEEAIKILEQVRMCYLGGIVEAINMAIDTLKSQEPVEPTLEFEGDTKEDNWYSCPICDDMVYYGKNYCEKCGKKLKWE